MHMIINQNHKETPMWAHKEWDILRNLSIFYVEKGIRCRSRGASACKPFIFLSAKKSYLIVYEAEMFLLSNGIARTFSSIPILAFSI